MDPIDQKGAAEPSGMEPELNHVKYAAWSFEYNAKKIKQKHKGS